jgi:hypothetical protein
LREKPWEGKKFTKIFQRQHAVSRFKEGYKRETNSFTFFLVELLFIPPSLFFPFVTPKIFEKTDGGSRSIFKR